MENKIDLSEIKRFARALEIRAADAEQKRELYACSLTAKQALKTADALDALPVMFEQINSLNTSLLDYKSPKIDSIRASLRKCLSLLTGKTPKP